MRRSNYNGKQDAEHLLETILNRKRWTVDDRDRLARFLEDVESGETQKKPQKRAIIRKK